MIIAQMMPSRWALVVLLAQLVSSNENSVNIQTATILVPEPSWGYRCVADEGCQRTEDSIEAGNTTVYRSLDLCRTVCGRFGGIWPKPVTAALSMQTVKIHPNYLSLSGGLLRRPLYAARACGPEGEWDCHPVRGFACRRRFIGERCDAHATDAIVIHIPRQRFDLLDVPADARSLLVEMTHVATANLLAECGGNVTDLVDTPVVVYITVKTDSKLTWATDERYMLDVQTRGLLDTQNCPGVCMIAIASRICSNVLDEVECPNPSMKCCIDESMKGNVAVHIVAETVYGARHALETFTHLVASDKSDFPDSSKCGLRLVSGAKIRDRPVYKHRGLTLDTSRNFVPLEDIKRTLDGMAATKMNVFHWHVTDSHSFPLESKRVPQFTRYGAYSESEIYTTAEVQELVHYALVRGIRVVIEIDAPAHAGNGWQWGKQFGLGELAVCVNNENWRHFCIQPPCGQLNPANPAMYRVLGELYADIAEVLPKPALLHMGGDEVFFNCWNSSAQILEYMRDKSFEMNTEGFIRLWAEFHARALHVWDEQLKKTSGDEQQPVLLWSSELTQAHRIQKYLDKNRYVIVVWEPIDSSLLLQLIGLGYRVISVPKDVWYLDHGFWGVTKFSNWRRMYAHTLPSDSSVLGGQVAMWSEYVDGNNLDTRVWPRAAAVGERLWADPTSGAGAAEPRMQRLRTRLLARGLRVDAIAPHWCAQHDSHCL